MAFSMTSPSTAFAGTQRIAHGALPDVARVVQQYTAGTTQADPANQALVLVFSDATGRQIELDLRGTPEEMLARLAQRAVPGDDPPASATRGPGRPKLGVVAREVTLLPRHWDWLAQQPGGASVALRRLVEEARRANSQQDGARQAQEAAYHFMSAMAGNLPGFEEATRALFANQAAEFRAAIQTWPTDVRDHALSLAAPAFARASEKTTGAT